MKKLIFCVLTVICLTLLGASAQDAQTTDFCRLYDTNVGTAGFIIQNGAYMAASKPGTADYTAPLTGDTPLIVRLSSASVGNTDLECVEASLSGRQIPSLDYKNTAVRIELKKGKATSGYRLGVTCIGDTHPNGSADVTRLGSVQWISIDDLLSSSENVNGWVTLTIPLTYFKDNGNYTVKESGEGSQTEFDWERVNGIYTACNHLQSDLKRYNYLYNIGNASFVEYLHGPDSVRADTYGAYNRIYWNTPKTKYSVDKYEIYKLSEEGYVKIGESDNAARYFDDTTPSTGYERYAVAAVGEGGLLQSQLSYSNGVQNSGKDNAIADNKVSVKSIKLFDSKGNEIAGSSAGEFQKQVKAVLHCDADGWVVGKLRLDVYKDGSLTESISQNIVNKGVGDVEYSFDKNFITVVPGEYTYKLTVSSLEGTDIHSLSKTLTKQDVTDIYEVSVQESAQQTMDGWGINIGSKPNECLQWQALWDKVDELGADYTRFFVSGEYFNADGSINDGYDTLIACIKNETDRGRSYILTFKGDAPGDWKENRVNNYWESSGWLSLVPCLKFDYEDIFVNNIVSQMKYIRSKGLPLPFSYSIQNEPQGATTNYTSPAQYARIVIALRKALDDNGFNSVKIMGPENVAYEYLYQTMGDSGVIVDTGSSSNRPLFDFSELARNPKLNDALGIVGVHSYQTPSDAAVRQKLAQSYKTSTAKYGKKAWQTEYSICGALSDLPSGLDYDMESLFMEISRLLGDVHGAGNSAWFHFMTYFHSGSLLSDGMTIHLLQSARYEPSQYSLIYGPIGSRYVETGNTYSFLKEIYTNAPKGSVVKLADTDWTDLDTSRSLVMDIGAFEYDGKTVIVLLNDTQSAAYVNVNNVSGSTYEIRTLVSGLRDAVATQTGSVADTKADKIYIPAKSANIIITN